MLQEFNYNSDSQWRFSHDDVSTSEDRCLISVDDKIVYIMTNQKPNEKRDQNTQNWTANIVQASAGPIQNDRQRHVILYEKLKGPRSRRTFALNKDAR